MTRLNQDTRSVIVGKALEKAGVYARKQALIERRAAWAEDVRIQALGGKGVEKRIKMLQKRFDKAVEDLPKNLVVGNLFSRDYDIRVNVAGLSVTAYFNGREGYHCASRVFKTTPDNTTLKTGPLVKEFHAIEAEKASIEEADEKIRTNVRATVSQFTTIEKLVEAWPEVEELLPKATAAAASLLPVVRAEDLNNLIGLPSEATA